MSSYKLRLKRTYHSPLKYMSAALSVRIEIGCFEKIETKIISQVRPTFCRSRPRNGFT